MGSLAERNGKVDLLPAKFHRAIELLLQASDYADRTTGDSWEFAVEIQQLQGIGLTPNDLRYLVRQGLVEHAGETTDVGQDGRCFHPTGDLTFTNRTCFVLSREGQALIRQTERSHPEVAGSLLHVVAPVDGGIHADGTLIPEWNAERRELRVEGRLVKRFKWHAENQERVLSAFEEEGWPFRIDDPLPPNPEQDSKRRLSDTVKCLNRKQVHKMLHFRGDGTGQGVVWELLNQGE